MYTKATQRDEFLTFGCAEKPRKAQDTPGNPCEYLTETPAGYRKTDDSLEDVSREQSVAALLAQALVCRCRGSLQELMLHETAVAWVRRGLTWTLPAKPWEETVEAFAVRLREVVRKVNDEYDVEGLCRELPDRVDALYHAEGGKLAK